MILLIDNYDSFVFNLARYFQRLGQETRVVRHDAIDVAGVRAARPAAVVLSPGPCTPNEAGCSVDIVGQLQNELPILGICLGHQAIAAAMGGRIARAREAMHGRTSKVHHDGRGIFTGVPNPLIACRYHSLVVEETGLPPMLEVTARTTDGVVMAVAHRERPVVGLQFHPESILTEAGYPLLANFLRMAGVSLPVRIPSLAEERSPRAERGSPLPIAPVTF